MSAVKQNRCQKITIPWGTWHGDMDLELGFPSQWDLDVAKIKDADTLTLADIQLSLQNPHGTDTLQSMATGKKNAVIAVEDITRPTRLEGLLIGIVDALSSAGLKDDQIKFIICNGAHAPMHKNQIEMKYGESLLKRFIFLNHNPYDNLTDTGIILGKTPVRLNSFFHEADLKIAVGTIMPHSFAGFSAGAKLLLPGLSDMATLERTHKFVMMGFRGGVNDVETNKFRAEIEDVAQKVGVDFFCGAVPNFKRDIAGIFTGDIIKAHRQGVAFARDIFKTQIKPKANIAVLNAYPKDTELIQADAALTPLKTIKESMVKENGIYIIISRCSDGYGYHSLFGPGMPLSRKPVKRGMLKKRDLIVFAPGINTPEFKTMYWDGYTLCNQWKDVLEIISEKYPSHCRVTVLPSAPLQLLEESQC